MQKWEEKKNIYVYVDSPCMRVCVGLTQLSQLDSISVQWLLC